MHPSSTTGPPSITAATMLSDIPDVVLRYDILTLLDAPTLASLSCVSRHFRSLIAAVPSSLWSLVCGATWPSTLQPLLCHVIPSFPTRDPHLFFFSQSYTVLDSDPGHSLRPSHGVRRLISALDLRYHGGVVFSRAAETETSSSWFVHSPFRIDLIEQKEAVQTPIPSLDSPDICQELRDGLTLSWIVVDPVGKRAANLSSHKAVSVERHWLSGEVQAQFSSVMGGERGTAREYVEFVVTVTLGGSTCGGNMEVMEVSMRAEDMEGNSVKGEESMRVMESGGFGGKKRGGTRRESAARVRHKEFLRKKAEWKEKKARKEERLDRCLCIGFGLAAVLGLWSFLCKAICTAQTVQTARGTSSLEHCNDPCPNRPRRLISAVDVRHRGDLIFSRAVKTDTLSGRIALSPFIIHLLEPGEVIPLRELPDADESSDLTLSWIWVDPEGKRTTNLSILEVLDICCYFIGEVHGRFFCELGGEKGTARELVQFEIVIVFGQDDDGLGEVRKLSMWAKDLEMKPLNGENSMGILERGALGATERQWKERGSVAGCMRDEFRHRSSMRQETMEAPRRFLQHIQIQRS